MELFEENLIKLLNFNIRVQILNDVIIHLIIYIVHSILDDSLSRDN